jgi:site-specific recombinase XerC
VDDAVQLASFQNPEADPWIEARDVAMTELLYSCGCVWPSWWGWICGPTSKPA